MSRVLSCVLRASEASQVLHLQAVAVAAQQRRPLSVQRGLRLASRSPLLRAGVRREPARVVRGNRQEVGSPAHALSRRPVPAHVERHHPGPAGDGAREQNLQLKALL
jgi:hypothetical protein